MCECLFRLLKETLRATVVVCIVVVALSVVEAVVGAMVGSPGQFTLRSPSVPVELYITKPGWLVVIVCWIQL